MKKLKTIENSAVAEIEEKRSRFIGSVFYVESVEEAEEIIKQHKKKYHDARHNCFAYIIKENIVVKKSSDDGEPSGTAGSPILNVLEKNNLCNVLAIVTRYFGGILLGAGGLVRAYTEATTKAMEVAKIVEQQEGYEIDIILSYPDMEKFKYYCNKNNIKIVNIEYNENIKCKIEITDEEKENLLNNDRQDKNGVDIIDYKIIKKKYIKK